MPHEPIDRFFLGIGGEDNTPTSRVLVSGWGVAVVGAIARLGIVVTC